MDNSRKSKAQLISELEELRRRLANPEKDDGTSGGTRQEQGESEERFRGLIDSSPMGICIHIDNRLAYANRAFSDLLGYSSPEEVLELADIGKLWAPGEYKRLREYSKARRAGKPAPVRYEYKALRKNGSEIWLENLVQMVEWRGSQAVMATVIDITDRKQAEEGLRESEERFRGLIDSSLMGIYIHIDNCLVYANRALSDLLGYDSPEEVLELVDVGKLRAPRERKRLRDYFEARRAGKPAPMRYEFKGLRKDGSDIWLENFVQMVEWRDSRAAMATVIDITDRKQAEEGLSRFKTTLDMTADCVFMFDPETLRFFYVNDGAVKQVKYSEREMLNMTPLDIKPEFDEPSFRKMLAPLLSGDAKSHMFETLHRTKEGVDIPVEVFLQYIAPESEEPRFVAIVRDISERRQAMEELQSGRKLLETVFDTVPQYVSMKDAQGRFQMVNQAFARKFNYEPEELIGKTLADVAEFDKTVIDLSNESDRRIYETGRPAPPRKERLTLPGGGERIGYVHKLPISDDAGNITGIVTINLDITELEAAQQASRQSEERFSAIAHSAPYPICVSALESGEYLYMNEPFKTLFEIGEELGPNLLAQAFYVDLSDREEILEAINREGKIQFFERELKKSSGERFWVVMSSVEMQYDGVRCAITGLVDITEQKHAAEELRANQRLLQTIFDTVPNWLYTKDADGRYQMVNRSMAEFFDLQPSEFVGKRIDEIITRKDDALASVVQLDRDVVRLNRMVNLPEATVAAPDGTTRIRHIVKLPLCDDAGNVIGIVGASEDITERKKAERALRESEERLSDAIDSIPDRFVLYDAEDRLIMHNRNFGEAYPGHAELYVPGSKFEDILRERVRRGEFAEAIGREEEWITERMHAHNNPKGPFELPLTNGRWLRIEERRTSQGGIVGLRTDITELKQVEEALRLSEERFRTTLDHSPSAITLKGLDGRFHLSNRRFNALLELTDKEIVGKTAHDIFPRDEADWTVAQDREVVESGKVIESEHEFILPNGSVYTCLLAKFPVIGADGELHGIGTISTDISAQRKVEQQLRESQKMEAVGQLAGGIAHDFNNMLQVIINRALFARESEQVDDEICEHLDAIVEAGEHAADLTRQLLAFSRKSVIQTVPLNLNDLTTNLMRMVGRVLGEQINLEFTPGHGLHYVKADPGMLEQVILNLCVNARDALPDGGRIHIETTNFHADANYCDQRGWDIPGDFVVLSVQDDGIGMTPEIKERVFEPFFTSKGVGEGTGLGLAMVYGIIRQHGGQLEVESAPGEGSTFKLLLPAMEHHEDSKEQTPAAEPPSGSETILVVEDQPSVREIISKMLTSGGYQVLTASDGEEAVELYKNRADDISLVILDMVLPKMSGRDTMAQIRKIRPDAAVLFSTGYSPDSVDKEFIGGNGLRLIQKPYARQEMLETVREVIDQH